MSDLPAWGPSASFLRTSGQQLSHTDTYVGAVEEICVLQRSHSGDGCDLASTLCKHDLRKGDLFVLSWGSV